MKIALVIPPAWSTAMPPLGAAYISTALRSMGHEVSVFDFNVEVLPALHPNQQELWERKHFERWTTETGFNTHNLDRVISVMKGLLEERIFSDNYQVVAFSVYSTSSMCTFHLLHLVRKYLPAAKTLIGGPFVNTTKMRPWLDHHLVDAAVVGEGDLAVKNLVHLWNEGKSVEHVAGVLTPDNYNRGNIIPELAPIDNLEIPDFSDYDLENYLDTGFPIQMSRGCVAKCAFCSETLKFRFRPALRVVTEIQTQMERFGVNRFHMVDSLVNGSAKILGSGT